MAIILGSPPKPFSPKFGAGIELLLVQPESTYQRDRQQASLDTTDTELGNRWSEKRTPTRLEAIIELWTSNIVRDVPPGHDIRDYFGRVLRITGFSDD